jgi:hypothetical protein
MDAVDREELSGAVAMRRLRIQAVDALDSQVAAVCQYADLLARAALIAAGYRQHHDANGENTVANAASQPKRGSLDMAAINKLLKRADAGDESAAPEIRGLMDEFPEVIEPLGGDLAHEAKRALVKAITGKNVGQREAIYRKMEQIGSELAGANPQPLEKLLIERAVLCWLHAYHADYQYGARGEVTLEFSEFLQRNQDRAQRRYLAAIKCLATVRRLALPIKVDVSVDGSLEGRAARPSCRRPSTAPDLPGRKPSRNGGPQQAPARN